MRSAARGRRRGRASRALVVAVSALFLLALVPSEAFARGGFKGGGSRSAPSLRSSGSGRTGGSWGSATRPSLAPRPSPSPKAGAGSGAAPGASAAPRAVAPGSAADPAALAPAARSPLPIPAAPRLSSPLTGSRSSAAKERSLYDTARSNGTLFSSKDEAARSFRESYGSRYSSNFSSEPATRPSYIPPTTMAGGRSVNIFYNPAFGGYGYMDPILGRWIMYDALADAAMAGAIMSGHGYYWGSPPAYVSHGASFVWFAVLSFIAFLVIVSLVAAIRFARRAREG